MSNSDNSLSSRHNTFNTPENIVFDLIKETVNAIPLNRKKIVKGYDNEVYEVETKEGPACIIRIKHFGESSMKQEEWVINQYKNAGVPVPVVYKTGIFQINDEEYEYMIQKKVSGQSLGEIKKQLTQEQLDKIYESAGKTLRKLHSVEVDGFYKRHENGVWDFTEWHRLANSDVVDRGKESSLLIQSGFTEEEVKQMIKYLEMHRDEFTCKQPVLCHGDYLEEHIFIDNNLNITAIIDFGMYRGDHPIHDFARLYMDSRFINMDVFKKGYGDHEMFHDRFEKRLLLHVLGNQMGHVAHYAREDMKPEVKYTAERLRETYEKLNGMAT
jgi:aminoglycoside phosphotransferase (APT) family kinase protein